jgi:hypothetical protein
MLSPMHSMRRALTGGFAPSEAARSPRNPTAPPTSVLDSVTFSMRSRPLSPAPRRGYSTGCETLNVVLSCHSRTLPLLLRMIAYSWPWICTSCSVMLSGPTAWTSMATELQSNQRVVPLRPVRPMTRICGEVAAGKNVVAAAPLAAASEQAARRREDSISLRMAIARSSSS